MFPYLKKLFNYFIFGNIYIAIAAACLTLETQLLLGYKFQTDTSVFLVFFSTLFVYNISRLQVFLGKQTFKWLLFNNTVYSLTTIGALLGLLVSMFLIELRMFVIMIPLALVSLGYSIRLRGIPGLKIFLISMVWGIVTVFIPVLKNDGNFLDVNILLLLIRRMLFVFAITIPFDIRDRAEDAIDNLKTIPGLLGEKKSKAIALGALVLFIIALFMHYRYEIQEWRIGLQKDTLPLLISAIVAGYFILKSSVSKNNYYYLVILDGTMILQFLLVYFFLKW